MQDKSPNESDRRADTSASRARHGRVRDVAEEPLPGSDIAGTDSLAKIIGAMFRSARQAQGLSQDQVAELTDGRGGPLSRTTVSSIERGRNLPNLEALVLLSRALHVEPLEVLERVDLSTTVPIDVTNLGYEDLREHAREYFWSGDYRRALAVYDAMYQRLVLDDQHSRRGALLARTEINRAVTLRQCSALKAAKAAAERAIELSDDAELQAQAYTVLASLHSHHGHLRLARVAIQQAIDLAEGCSDTVKGQTWYQLGSVLHRAGEYEEAQRAYMRAAEFSARALDYHNLIKVEGSIAESLIELGKLRTARTKLAKAVKMARLHGDPAAEAFWLVELGRLSLLQRQLDEAESYARKALQVARPASRVLTVFRAEWLQYLVAKARSPVVSDKRRLAYLRKLYPRVKQHKVDAVEEFREQILNVRADASGGADE